MSISDAKRFIQDVADNKSLQDEVKTKTSGLQSLVDFGLNNGYVFTLAELKQVVLSAAERDLTDDELEHLAGGARAVPATELVATTQTSGIIQTFVTSANFVNENSVVTTTTAGGVMVV